MRAVLLVWGLTESLLFVADRVRAFSMRRAQTSKAANNFANENQTLNFNMPLFHIIVFFIH